MLNIHRRGTGGGPPASSAEQLTETEQQILETLNTTAINGHEEIAETEVSFVCISFVYICIIIIMYKSTIL